MIEGVEIMPLKYQFDERSRRLTWGERGNLPNGEIRETALIAVYPGIVDAWHYSQSADQYLACVKGSIKLALFDSRRQTGSFGEIKEFFMGEHNPAMIKIPGGVYRGWKCLDGNEAWLMRFCAVPGLEEQHVAPDTDLIPYRW